MRSLTVHWLTIKTVCLSLSFHKEHYKQPWSSRSKTDMVTTICLFTSKQFAECFFFLVKTDFPVNASILQGHQFLIKSAKGKMWHSQLHTVSISMQPCSASVWDKSWEYGPHGSDLGPLTDCFGFFFSFWSCTSQSPASPPSLHVEILTPSLPLSQFFSLHSLAHLSTRIKSWGEYMKRSVTF